MAKLRERHEVVAEANGRTFVFLAEPDEGRLSIREVDADGEEELCGLTLSDAEEIEGFFAGLHRVLTTAGVSRGGFLGKVLDEDLPALDVGGSQEGDPDAEPEPPARSGDGDRQRRVDAARRKNARAFTAWTADEEQEVWNRYRAGESLEALARSRGRSKRAIEMRLEKMGVLKPEDLNA